MMVLVRYYLILLKTLRNFSIISLTKTQQNKIKEGLGFFRHYLKNITSEAIIIIYIYIYYI